MLNTAGNAFVSERIAELWTKPVATDTVFTVAHMRSLHRHLFRDVYAWAGQPRNVPMTKKGASYAEPAQMAALLRHQSES